MGFIVTGEHLKLARLIYGYESQEALGREIGASLGTIQRYEASEEVDAKVLGIYEHQLGFDLNKIVFQIDKLRRERKVKALQL
jgi:hypothetical protein